MRERGLKRKKKSSVCVCVCALLLLLLSLKGFFLLNFFLKLNKIKLIGMKN